MADRLQRQRLVARLLWALALLALAGTYVAAQIDFARRHQPNQPWRQYWIPQITHVWLPGLGGAAGLAVAALVLQRRSRRAGPAAAAEAPREASP